MNAEAADKGRALVLGGGGVTGIAWATGMLKGLADAGVDLSTADVFIGTSAGSVVAAQLTSGIPIDELYEVQLATDTGENSERMSRSAIARFMIASALPGSRQRARAWLGRAALRARTLPEAERFQVFEQGLPREWPQQRLLITAVNAETGEAVVFDKQSQVPLVNAVAASCAVPLVWPPVTINGQRYMDGGVRSVANVDLARGYERLVVIAPIVVALRRSDRPATQIAMLGNSVRSALVSPDAAASEAIGNNLLDPAHRAASAQAGRAQASAVVEQVRTVWS